MSELEVESNSMVLPSADVLVSAENEAKEARDSSIPPLLPANLTDATGSSLSELNSSPSGPIMSMAGSAVRRQGSYKAEDVDEETREMANLLASVHESPLSPRSPPTVSTPTPVNAVNAADVVVGASGVNGRSGGASAGPPRGQVVLRAESAPMGADSAFPFSPGADRGDDGSGEDEHGNQGVFARPAAPADKSPFSAAGKLGSRLVHGGATASNQLSSNHAGAIVAVSGPSSVISGIDVPGRLDSQSPGIEAAAIMASLMPPHHHSMLGLRPHDPESVWRQRVMALQADVDEKSQVIQNLLLKIQDALETINMQGEQLQEWRRFWQQAQAMQTNALSTAHQQQQQQQQQQQPQTQQQQQKQQTQQQQRQQQKQQKQLQQLGLDETSGEQSGILDVPANELATTTGFAGSTGPPNDPPQLIVGLPPLPPLCEQSIASTLSAPAQMHLQVVEHPPGTAVYQRILRPFPVVAVLGVPLNFSTTLYVEASLMKKNMSYPDQAAIPVTGPVASGGRSSAAAFSGVRKSGEYRNMLSGQLLVRADATVPGSSAGGGDSDGASLALETGEPAAGTTTLYCVFKKLKILTTTAQQGGSFFLIQFKLKRYNNSELEEVPKVPASMSNPIEVFSHTLYLKSRPGGAGSSPDGGEPPRKSPKTDHATTASSKSPEK